MTPDILTYILGALCLMQVYTWWRFSTFEQVASINILGMINLYSTKLLELEEEIAKLKEQIKKYEDKTNTPDN